MERSAGPHEAIASASPCFLTSERERAYICSLHFAAGHEERCASQEAEFRSPHGRSTRRTAEGAGPGQSRQPRWQRTLCRASCARRKPAALVARTVAWRERECAKAVGMRQAAGGGGVCFEHRTAGMEPGWTACAGRAYSAGNTYAYGRERREMSQAARGLDSSTRRAQRGMRRVEVASLARATCPMSATARSCRGSSLSSPVHARETLMRRGTLDASRGRVCTLTRAALAYDASDSVSQEWDRAGKATRCERRWMRGLPRLTAEHGQSDE
ncbi:hypothetical protein OH77DRAFT_1024334 [Trametes cingulata]|nr:hypothetical protein OH77DRAFT_1024334 [Trametes cingulata]